MGLRYIEVYFPDFNSASKHERLIAKLDSEHTHFITRCPMSGALCIKSFPSLLSAYILRVSNTVRNLYYRIKIWQGN
eukprot:snap_masked-scaffold_8-processed-gene-12.16-mRNA-1 protein AED:1.00 eAED:1.00 QI:0/0/0/0/1/1/2/0/76